MIIVDAYWDQKVTGCKTCEIIFEKNDDFNKYLKEEIESKFDYSVIKIPVGDIGIVQKFEDFGYRYLENQFSLSFKVEQIDRIDNVWFRLFEGFSYEEVCEESGISLILERVEDKMFDADRYSVDPLWDDNISSERYRNWIQTLYKMENTKFYSMIKNGLHVGFFSLKSESKTVISCPIAGIYNEFKFSGYIFILVYSILQICRQNKVNQFITSISSNNKNLLSSFSKAFNFRVNEIYVVLRKIINE